MPNSDSKSTNDSKKTHPDTRDREIRNLRWFLGIAVTLFLGYVGYQQTQRGNEIAASTQSINVAEKESEWGLTLDVEIDFQSPSFSLAAKSDDIKVQRGIVYFPLRRMNPTPRKRQMPFYDSSIGQGDMGIGSMAFSEQLGTDTQALDLLERMIQETTFNCKGLRIAHMEYEGIKGLTSYFPVVIETQYFSGNETRNDLSYYGLWLHLSPASGNPFDADSLNMRLIEARQVGRSYSQSVEGNLRNLHSIGEQQVVNAVQNAWVRYGEPNCFEYGYPVRIERDE